MGNLVYVLAASGVILLGILVIALRNRSPRTVDSGIRDHRRHMGALSIDARRSLIASSRSAPQGPAGGRSRRRTARE